MFTNIRCVGPSFLNSAFDYVTDISTSQYVNIGIAAWYSTLNHFHWRRNTRHNYYMSIFLFSFSNYGWKWQAYSYDCYSSFNCNWRVLHTYAASCCWLLASDKPYTREFTVLIDRIIGRALLQTKAIQFQILPSIGHLDQNTGAQKHLTNKNTLLTVRKLWRTSQTEE